MKQDEQNIIIKVKGSIVDSQDDHESVELETEGKYYIEDGAKCFAYHESAIYGMKGTKTIIKVKNDQVSLQRIGQVSSIMDFIPNKRNVTLYATPYGEMSLGIITNKLTIDYKKNQISHILIDYTLEIGDITTSVNKIDIKIRYLNAED